jgi:hypothetical protein
MNAHIAHHGYGLTSLRAALHWPQRAVPWVPMPSAIGAAPAGWLERLALWAERQPMHHRLGSYTRLR